MCLTKDALFPPLFIGGAHDTINLYCVFVDLYITAPTRPELIEMLLLKRRLLEDVAWYSNYTTL